MGTLVLDIETANPFEEPPENSNDTQYYELFAVSLAYADDIESTPETEVLFRRGDWEDSHTIDLYQRMFEWCDERDVDRLLTYNGAWFDGKHLLNWAQDIDATRNHGFLERTEALFENHVDVALAAADE
jgi:DNA polymerase elongation subunit (family B)